ncbi:protoporphyrinogen oxidase HemJ [Ciceribacter sp. L1K22]|uniref:protoporphyrinogen oxidase HemJ n=1 Tax=Ciceribacter sp. L1K22 TaxID=2820275 RepID=UPI001ABE1370|nr:protoporphyrinogen oxidase HemJ [Ciceribacter sp. L1K22]MBO3758270.1 protoporphyrinogen oxidase HemJ [Ciceribacter sp. L1K22]
MSESRDKGRSAGRRAMIALSVFVAGALALFLLDDGQRYLWIKALHVIAVLSWMAGLLYLPRLFIYHCDAQPNSVQAETFSIMERRLFRFIMTPAMILSWVFGLYLAWDVFGFRGGWLHLKLLSVVVLTAAHFYFGRAVGAFAKGTYIGNGRFWRITNEVPTILMIVIVILVVVKPF